RSCYFAFFLPVSFVSPHKSNKIKSNFICTAHFIQGGKTMRLTVGKKGGGLQTLVKKTQIFQRSINRKLRTNHTGPLLPEIQNKKLRTNHTGPLLPEIQNRKLRTNHTGPCWGGGVT